MRHQAVDGQRGNEWITSELQRLADDQPDLVRAEHSSCSDRVDYYLWQLPNGCPAVAVGAGPAGPGCGARLAAQGRQATRPLLSDSRVGVSGR